MKDLFGNEISVEAARQIERTGKKKRNEMARGYRGTPGLGPKGETCKTCLHAHCRQRSKRYWKCGLVKATGGPKTDIRLKSPACQFWEQKNKIA